MKTVRLGKTGLKVSRIGMGGIPIVRPPADDAVKIIRRALDLGVNFIDTAYAYGSSEERIGEAVAARRDQVLLATKTIARDKKTAIQHLELSLKRLRTEYIDLWQFHNITTLAEYEQVLSPGGTIEAAQEALKAGKIKHVGASTHNPDVARKVVCSGIFETIQFPFNFVNNEAADELIPLAKKKNVGFIAMKPFAGGRLKNEVDLAIRYLLQFNNVVPDPGIQKIEEIEQIVNIVNGSWKLTSEDRMNMEEIRVKVGVKFCQGCGYCLPCPQNVNIPFLLSACNVDSYGKGNYLALLKEKEVGKTCLKCGACEEKCPFHLPIREQLVESIRFLESLTQGEKRFEMIGRN